MSYTYHIHLQLYELPASVMDHLLCAPVAIFLLCHILSLCYYPYYYHQKCLQCKSSRERFSRFTPYHSNDPAAPQYKPVESKNKKGKQYKTKEDQQRRLRKNYWYCSWNLPVPHQRIQGRPDSCTETLRRKWKTCGTARI